MPSYLGGEEENEEHGLDYLLSVLSLCWYDSDETSASSSVGCKPRWIVHPNTVSYNMRRNSAKTQRECLEACVAANSSCAVVEWSASTQCWTSERLLEQEQLNGVTQFEIVRLCDSTSGRATRRQQVNFNRIITFERTTLVNLQVSCF